jgi:hypothetical protein
MLPAPADIFDTGPAAKSANRPTDGVEVRRCIVPVPTREGVFCTGVVGCFLSRFAGVASSPRRCPVPSGVLVTLELCPLRWARREGEELAWRS